MKTTLSRLSILILAAATITGSASAQAAVPEGTRPPVAENGSYYGQPNAKGVPKTVYVRSHYRARPAARSHSPRSHR